MDLISTTKSWSLNSSLSKLSVSLFTMHWEQQSFNSKLILWSKMVSTGLQNIYEMLAWSVLPYFTGVMYQHTLGSFEEVNGSFMIHILQRLQSVSVCVCGCVCWDKLMSVYTILFTSPFTETIWSPLLSFPSLSKEEKAVTWGNTINSWPPYITSSMPCTQMSCTCTCSPCTCSKTATQLL